MIDLFGNEIAEPEPASFETEYAEYIASPKWRVKREAALARAEWTCQRCGRSKYSVRLDVHHLSYEHFRSEPPADLIVLCADCHAEADAERVKQATEQHEVKLERSPFWVGFHNWMARGSTVGAGWVLELNETRVRAEAKTFARAISRRMGRDYDPEFLVEAWRKARLAAWRSAWSPE